MFCFRVFQNGKATTVPLQESFLTGGSAPDNEIVLADPAIPGVAFRMTLDVSGYTLSSAHAQSKPVVNGKRADKILLRAGDRLEIGSLALVLDNLEEIPGSVQVTSSAGHGSASGAINSGRDASLPGFREGLARLCALVAGERDLQTLLTKTMGLLLEVFGGKEAFLFILDENLAPTLFVSSRGNTAPRGKDSQALFSDTLVRQALRERKGMVVRNALADPQYSGSRSISDLKLHSVLCCPILAGGQVSGLIYLGSNVPAVSYGDKELSELEVYALVAGCLINHVGYIAMQDKMLAALRSEGSREGMVATSPVMKRILDEARMVASADIAVLIQGETGTGKDVLANHIHQQSRRRDKPFVVVNCSTLRGELLASELFGHKKGSFTGAVSDEPGLFRAADGGTLFLDEIGEMDPGLQAMLLRTLEIGKVRSVGQSGEVAVDVRIVSATNRNLEENVAKGAFRQDLFYRINQHALHLPPLRERGEDVLLLAQLFLEKAKALFPEKKIEAFHPETLFAISRYSWPGNIRELANAVRKAALFADSQVVRLVFPASQEQWADMEEATRRFQRDYLQKALSICGGDKEKAAALLGMGRSTFFRHLSQAKDDEGGSPAA